MPRAAALDLLDAVLRRKQPLDEALANDAGFPALEPRDRAFARNLAATTLRRLGQIDALVAACVERPLPKKAGTALGILRLGATQLVFLQTPPHAAVDTAVALAHERGQEPYAKLVNAVLRRLATEGAALEAQQDAARLNTPDWLWHSWSATYGEDVCRRIAEAHLRDPPLDLSVKSDPEAWAERLGARVLPTVSLRLDGAGPIADLPGFAEGAWWVQDAAAALPARLLGDVAGAHVIDLCAAPGGKSAQLALAGARVTAVDRSPKRMEMVAENMARLGLEAELVVADAIDWRPDQPANAVLLDAPCTATGAIRRHPDIPHLKRPEDVAAMAAVQSRLLTAALDMVRPGGLIVYCVCSLEPEEGPERIAALASAGASVKPVPIVPSEVAGNDELVTADGVLRTLPCHSAEDGGMDGFFATKLKRA